MVSASCPAGSRGRRAAGIDRLEPLQARSRPVSRSRIAKKMRSGLAGLAIGIAPVALGLAGGFVFENAGDAGRFGGDALLGFPARFRFDGSIPRVFLRPETFRLSRVSYFSRTMTLATTKSPVTASRLSPAGMNKSPCALGTSGMTKPNPRDVCRNVPVTRLPRAGS